MRKVSFDIKQNSEPSKLRILFRMCLPKRFTSPEGTFRVEHYVFLPPSFCLTSPSTSSALPFSLMPEDARDISSRTRESVCLSCASCGFPLCLHMDCMHTHFNPDRGQNIQVAHGETVLLSPHAHPSPGTPFGDPEGGHKWLRHHLPSEIQWFALYLLMESLLPTNSLQSFPLTPSLLIYFPGEKLAYSYKGCDKAWLAVPLLRCLPSCKTRTPIWREDLVVILGRVIIEQNGEGCGEFRMDVLVGNSWNQPQTKWDFSLCST